MSYPNDIYVYLTDTVGSGLPSPTPGDLPNPGIEPGSPALQVDVLPLSHQGSPWETRTCVTCKEVLVVPDSLRPHRLQPVKLLCP